MLVKQLLSSFWQRLCCFCRHYVCNAGGSDNDDKGCYHCPCCPELVTNRTRLPTISHRCSKNNSTDETGTWKAPTTGLWTLWTAPLFHATVRDNEHPNQVFSSWMPMHACWCSDVVEDAGSRLVERLAAGYRGYRGFVGTTRNVWGVGLVESMQGQKGRFSRLILDGDCGFLLGSKAIHRA